MWVFVLAVPATCTLLQMLAAFSAHTKHVAAALRSSQIWQRLTIKRADRRARGRRSPPAGKDESARDGASRRGRDVFTEVTLHRRSPLH